jgi:hypothetical protein
MKSRTPLISAIMFVALPLSAHADSNRDPVFGTWKLDLAKSSFDSRPTPASQSRIYEATADGRTKVTILTTTASGETQMRGSTHKEDGTPHAVSGSQSYDADATTRISPLRAKDALTRSGQVVGRLIRVESNDHRTMRITLTFTTPSRQSEHDVLVYNRQ